MTSWFLGVDVGGTFTDVVLASPDGDVHTGKVVTTPDDPRIGVIAGVREVLRRTAVDPASVTRVVHGTTLATNVILERKGGPVALVTTEGFADLLRLGREARVEGDRYDLFFQPLQAPVDPQMTFEVAERMTALGEVLVPLDAEQVASVANRLAAARPAGVAVCLLHAYANPAHERAVTEACRSAVPDAFAVASSEVWPEMREYERAMTTVMCAYVGPVMASYLAGLGSQLAALGLRCPVQIMESSGGMMPAALAAERPVHTIESGGAAGVIAAGFVGRLLGAGEVISFDMGGTTAKAGIVREGRPSLTHDFQIGGKGSFGGARPGTGFPVKIPVADLAEVGAGGGSIAWVDPGRALRVGPASSGSVPGPACYGRGGTEPTVTDANLVLGYLNPSGLAGGVVLSEDLAAASIERAVAGPLGLDVAAAARGIHDIVTANMAAAIRVVTVQRGIDPRQFVLVVFGGAGPLHAARLAATFGIRWVAVPWAAGVASALGLVSADLTADLVQTRVVDLDQADATEVEGLFAALEDRGRRQLGDGLAPGTGVVVRRSADLRYRGQAHQLTVPLPESAIGGDELSLLAKRFHEVYLHTYGVDLPAPVQLVSARVQVVSVVDKVSLRPRPSVDGDPSAAVVAERAAYFPEIDGFGPTPVYDWARLEPGYRLAGPAIIEGPDTTIVVPPGYAADHDRWRNVILRPRTFDPAPGP